MELVGEELEASHLQLALVRLFQLTELLARMPAHMLSMLMRHSLDLLS